MAEANYYQDEGRVDFTPAAAVAAGEVVLLPDGRAGVATSAIAAGELGSVETEGVHEILKADSVVLLQGGNCRWDASAGKATYPVYTDDLDFHVGTIAADAAASATTVKVHLNQRSTGIVNLESGAFANVPVLTAGAPFCRQFGGSVSLGFSATAEAQKEDILSVRSFPISSNWIAEFVATVVTNADADVADLSVGVANATHASDADAITESVFFHFDMGADLNLDAESDDGTTEVNATDTTVDWAVGTPLHLAIDGRDETDCQLYVNGALVLSGSTFTLADATGPLKLLVHLEKSANDSPGEVRIDLAEVRITPEI